MPWQSAYGGGGDVASEFGIPAAEPPHHGGPFINWSSPGSVLSAPFRATAAAGNAGLGLVESAWRGLPGMALGAGKEAANDIKFAYEDLRHPGVRSSELLMPGGPALTRGISRSMPALHLNYPWQHDEQFPLQPGQQPLPDQPTGLGPFVGEVGKTAPVSAPVILGPLIAGTHAEQLARAGGNRLLPGQPFGAGVGQLGAGPAGLGNTEYAKAAARGGGGVLPLAVGDIASMAPFLEGGNEVAAAASKAAADQAAEHAAAATAAESAAKEATTAAERNIDQAAQQYERAVQQRADIAQQAAGGHPAAAAAYQAAEQGVQSAGEALRQAQAAAEQTGVEHAGHVSFAQQAADEAQARAQQIGKRAEAAKLVTKLGIKAANSPFAPMEYGLPLVGKAGEAITGTEFGQTHVQPIIERMQGVMDRAQGRRMASRMRQNEILDELEAQQRIQQGYRATEAPLPTAVSEPRRRGPLGLFGHTTDQVPDYDAHAVATMAQTGEGEHMANLVRRFGPEEAVAHFKASLPNPEQYTPEQLALATEVFGNANTAALSEKAAQVREAIPAVREAYAKSGGALEFQNERYARLAGEAGLPSVRPTPGTGAWEQVQHNLQAEGVRMESLDQYHRIIGDQLREGGKIDRRIEKAAKRMTKSAEGVQSLGLSEAERANPRLVLQRMYEAPTAAARAVADQGPHVWQAMAQSPEKGLASLGRQVVGGKLAPEQAIQGLADQIVKLAAKDPDKLSPTALTVVEEARQAGMPEVAGRVPQLANVSGMTAPAQRLGVGAERLRAGQALEQTGAARLERADRMYQEAQDRIGEPTRDAAAKVQAAVTRSNAATAKLGDLIRKVQAAANTVTEGEADLFAHAGVNRRDVVEAVRDARRAVKDQFRAEAEALQSSLDQMTEGSALKWPPEKELKRTTIDKAGAANKGQVVRRMAYKEDTVLGDVRGQVAESGMTHDTRFFRPDGLTPEELVNHIRGYKGVGGQALGAGESADEIFGRWMDTVGKIRDLEAAARVGVERGWDPRQFAEPRSMIVEHLAGQWGEEIARELGPSLVQGSPKVVAEELHGRLNDLLGSQRMAEVGAARTSAVEQALEADRANETQRGTVGRRTGRASLDAIGKAMYDQRVAEDQARIQGQVAGQREAQVGQAAAAGAERARTQGRTEGALLGGSQQLARTAESDLTAAERAQGQGRALVGQGPELAQEAVARTAGPWARVYREAGEKQQKLAERTADYQKELRARERLDETTQAKLRALEQSVVAAPRAMRPVLEMGARLREHFNKLADAADRDLGEGAGDEYRNAAAEATLLQADNMSRYGIDPQYLIGQRSRLLPVGEAPERPVELSGGGPTVGRTGQREAGIGLEHATNYRELARQDAMRARQQIENETAQQVIDAGAGMVGASEGTVRGLLEAKGVDVGQIGSTRELAKLLKDNGVAMWNFADRRGSLVNLGDMELDRALARPAVPVEVWKGWQRYASTKGPEGAAGAALHLWDKGTLGMKRLIRLSPRWQAAVAIGHTIMGMAGTLDKPSAYFGHDIPTAIKLEKLMTAGGPQTAEDEAFVRSLHPDVQRALAEHQGVPGSVRNRGFIREEFKAAHPKRPYLGSGMLGVQSKLDNINRTAIWIHHLENLTDRGVADFRRQFPEMAHLSDSQVRNEGAIRLSIRTLGDYLNSTPLERQAISRVVFFYPWLRHITKLALNTAIHEPLRTAWLLHMGAMFDPGEGPVPFLGMSYGIGGHRFVTPPNVNPFLAISGAAQNPLGVFNPLVKAGVGAATGFNMNTGKPITRPYFEPGGRLSGGEALNYTLNQVPFLPQVRESVPAALGSPAIVRYQTGQPIITRQGFIPSNETQWLGTNASVPGAVAPWLPYLGLPYQRNVDTEQILHRQLASEQRNARAARKYAVRRAVLSAG